MDFDKYKSKLPYGLSKEDKARKIELQELMAKPKPADRTHQEHGKLLDSAEKEIHILKEKEKENRSLYRQEEDDIGVQFWDDAFAELDCDDIPEKIKCSLSSRAWQEGHSYGYQEVFNHLDDLVDFFREIESVLKEQYQT